MPGGERLLGLSPVAEFPVEPIHVSAKDQTILDEGLHMLDFEGQCRPGLPLAVEALVAVDRGRMSMDVSSRRGFNREKRRAIASASARFDSGL
jgi:hypothetical protein